jgi:hypothetical protein
MEDGNMDGRSYASGMHVKEGDILEDEQPVRKRARHNNPLTSTQVGCKCGSLEHHRVSSKNCCWNGLGKKEVEANYEKRRREIEMRMVEIATESSCTGPTTEIVQTTGTILAPT